MKNLICTNCGKQMSNYFEVGYDGPRDEGLYCHPFADWLTLCQTCADLEGFRHDTRQRDDRNTTALPGMRKS